MLIKAFRLFVSSTFADFVAERNVLQREVFPTLDAYCTGRGYQFYPLDLRWGVNEEAQLDHRTAEICLNEVRAAKKDYPPPNFLIMIGQRYGLVPLPYAIAADEFEAILDWLEGQNQRDAAGALEGVYERDDNYLLLRALSGADPRDDGLVAAYTLRSRLDELPELRSAEAWTEREARLRPILQEAADGLWARGRIDAAAREKYFLSLTDQEIIYGLPGYRPFFDGAPAPLSSAAEGPSAIAFIRELVSESGKVPEAIRNFFEEQPLLGALKDGIRRALPADHILTLRPHVDRDGRFSEAYLADFSAQIQDKLKAAIDKCIIRVEAIEHAPDYALTSEREAQRAFANQRLEIFVGRENALAKIASYLAESAEQPLILHGRSGLGKSSLMARAIADAGGGPAPVVADFIGATAASSNVRTLLISVIDDLAAHRIVAKPAEFEQDANKFSAQIKRLLSSITNPAVVFLDALDQLQQPHDLSWLPAKLPRALKLVVSVLDDPDDDSACDFYRDLRNRLAVDAFLEIGPAS